MADYAVVCTHDPETDRYTTFLHEADILLAGLGLEVEAGRMTADRAREVWLPYRAFDEGLYDPEVIAEDPEYFPLVTGDYDYLPASTRFHDRVLALEVPGVDEPDMGRPMSFAVEGLEIVGTEALDQVRDELRKDYCIVPYQEFEPMKWSTGLEACQRLIADARNRAGLSG